MPSLIPPAIIAELDSKRQSWGMKGTGFVVVKKSAESGEWEREYVCLGVKDKEDRPFDKDTIFPIASISKHFTAIAVHLALQKHAEQHKHEPGFKPFNFDSKMRNVLPGFEMSDEMATRCATIGDVMSHMSGLARHDIALNPNEDAEQHLERLKHLKFDREFRRSLSHGNYLFTIMPLVV